MFQHCNMDKWKPESMFNNQEPVSTCWMLFGCSLKSDKKKMVIKKLNYHTRGWIGRQKRLYQLDLWQKDFSGLDSRHVHGVAIAQEEIELEKPTLKGKTKGREFYLYENGSKIRKKLNVADGDMIALASVVTFPFHVYKFSITVPSIV